MLLASCSTVEGIGCVLVGLDGSPESLVALRWAGWFATATQRDLHVVHAWQHGRPLGALTPHTGVEDLESTVEHRLREISDEELGSGVVTDCRAVRGPSAGALAREAARMEASLIVVGARGAGGALRALLGSVSRELTECPARAVAVVPEHEVVPGSGDLAVVVGVDGSSGSSRALRWSADTARRAGAEVVAVHSFEAPADLTRGEEAALTDETRARFEEEWCAPLRRLEVTYRPLLHKGHAREVIRRVADQVRPACVVVGSRGLGPVSQRLLGSVTHDLVRQLDWPTVIVPSARDCVIWKI